MKRFLLALLLLNFSLPAAEFVPSFTESMKRGGHSDHLFLSSDPAMQKCRVLYKKWRTRKNESPRSIPRYIHFIHVGGSIPDYIEETIATWKKRHPGWTVKVWMDSDVPYFQMKNKSAFDNASDPLVRASIWCYEILERFGGLYVDNDSECLQSLKKVRKQCSFFAVMKNTREARLSGHLIGSVAHHPLLKSCIQAIGENSQNVDVLGDALLKAEAATLEHVVVFPASYFPVVPQEKKMAHTTCQQMKKKWGLKEAFAIDYGVGRRPLSK